MRISCVATGAVINAQPVIELSLMVISGSGLPPYTAAVKQPRSRRATELLNISTVASTPAAGNAAPTFAHRDCQARVGDDAASPVVMPRTICLQFITKFLNSTHARKFLGVACH